MSPPTVYLVWAEGMGMMPAPDPTPARVPGHEGAMLYLAPYPCGRRVLFAAFEGRAGLRLTEPTLTRGEARGALLALFHDDPKAGRTAVTRAEIDRLVDAALAAREASL